MIFRISDDRFRELLQIEEEVNCDIGAGYDGAYLREFLADPKSFQQIRQLQEIVVAEFQALLETLDLGIGQHAAFVCGRDLVLERFRNPSVEIQEQLWEAASPEKLQLQTGRDEIKLMLHQLLTQQDWEKIAAAAATTVRNQVLEYPRQMMNAS